MGAKSRIFIEPLIEDSETTVNHYPLGIRRDFLR
jgi:hypothetical protein